MYSRAAFDSRASVDCNCVDRSSDDYHISHIASTSGSPHIKAERGISTMWQEVKKKPPSKTEKCGLVPGGVWEKQRFDHSIGDCSGVDCDSDDCLLKEGKKKAVKYMTNMAMLQPSRRCIDDAIALHQNR